MPKKTLDSIAIETQQAYLKTKAKARGNLHERMKHLELAVRNLVDSKHNEKDPDLTQLIENVSIASIELESEVAFHVPANPPFTKRQKLSKSDWQWSS